MRRNVVIGALVLVIAIAAGIQFLIVGNAWGGDPTAWKPTGVWSLTGVSSATEVPSTVGAKPLAVLPTPVRHLPIPRLAVSTPTATPVRPTATPAPSPTPTPTPTPIGPVKTGGAQAPPISAAYAIVVDEKSGQVLYDKNGHTRVAPASLTKIVTALVALGNGNPTSRVKTDFDPTDLVDSTLMGLHVGDEMALEDLLYGLMLPSGNDAALAIAQHIGGSKARFSEMMNQKARSLGLVDSQFKNPHGLDEDGHYSSPYDMVMMARYGMLNYPLFAQLSAAKYWTITSSRGTWDVYNLNKFLSQYKGADGVKIGYTDDAGRAIVASAVRDGHRVYVGMMRSADLWSDSAALLDYVFANYTWR